MSRQDAVQQRDEILEISPACEVAVARMELSRAGQKQEINVTIVRHAVAAIWNDAIDEIGGLPDVAPIPLSTQIMLYLALRRHANTPTDAVDLNYMPIHPIICGAVNRILFELAEIFKPKDTINWDRMGLHPESPVA